MAFPERDEDIGVTGANEAAVAIAEGDAGVRDADVIKHAAVFLSGNFGAKFLLDFVDKAGGFFNARAAAGAEVEPELAGVNRREEVLAKLRRQKERADTEQEE